MNRRGRDNARAKKFTGAGSSVLGLGGLGALLYNGMAYDKGVDARRNLATFNELTKHHQEVLKEYNKALYPNNLFGTVDDINVDLRDMTNSRTKNKTKFINRFLNEPEKYRFETKYLGNAPDNIMDELSLSKAIKNNNYASRVASLSDAVHNDYIASVRNYRRLLSTRNKILGASLLLGLPLLGYGIYNSRRNGEVKR